MPNASLMRRLPVASRRQRFKDFMQAFNPTASAKEMLSAGLLDESLHSNLYRHLAARADLEPGSQQLIVGGIGSGKTTELILAERELDEGSVEPLYIDLTSETDLSDLKSGSLLASFGLHMLEIVQLHLPEIAVSDDARKVLAEARRVIREFAHGKILRMWVSEQDSTDEPPDYDDPSERGYYTTTRVPGKLSPPLPKIRQDLREIKDSLALLVRLSCRASGGKEHIVLICDGLDRLITSDNFWAVAHQDCRLLRELGVSLLVSGPLSILYTGREVGEHFDRVQHIAALKSDETGLNHLETVIGKRGGYSLLNREQVNDLCRWSGGVLRDLITLARDAAEEAYLQGKESIDDSELEAAVRQLGTSYLRGLNTQQQNRLRSLQRTPSFDSTDATDIMLLATRRILEYSATDFRVHPALWQVMES